ncbi:MAG: transcriptional regulator NrdR [Anaerolineae bacterium]|nr:transcriptional regulator NrdR [Anaerolineae bacterium]
MECPYCGADGSKVIHTTRDVGGSIRRRRECKSCGVRFNTFERAELTTPMLIKHDGNREEFNREKLIHAIRMACAKRPVSASAITCLAEGIEHALQQLGCDEVPSQTVGDMVVRGLRELDQVAYVRYALIYLQLNNLDGVLNEIDRLMAFAEN